MVNWRKYPFVRILFPFILGIMFSFEGSYYYMITIVVALFALIIISKTKKNIKNNFLFGVVFYIILFVGGSLLVQISLNDYTKLEEADFYQCAIIEPIKEKTSGSTFRNTENNKAWKLIQDSGCKRYSVGQAAISDLHSNFIVNKGGASSNEIEELGEKVIKKVYDKFGIKLIWEIKIIGNK